jgi:IMP dehydrogenase
MSCPAIVVSPDDSVWDASQLMMTSGVRHLVVCFQGRVVGVVDDRTVFAHWPTGPLTVRRTRLAEILRSRTSCVLEDVGLRRTAELMLIDGCDAIPVVDDEGRVLGIITTSDLIAAVATHGIIAETP